MNVTVKTRRARPEDAAAILPLSAELYAMEGLGFDRDAARTALDHLLVHPELGFAFVAEDDDGRVLGYAICTYGYDLEFNGRDALLTEVLVAAPARVRGIGNVLLAEVEREAAREGAHAVHLLVRPDNAPALALYEGRGYEKNPRYFLSKRVGHP